MNFVHKKISLPNGLRLIVNPIDGTEQVSTRLVFDFGENEEDLATAEFFALFEHLAAFAATEVLAASRFVGVKSDFVTNDRHIEFKFDGHADDLPACLLALRQSLKKWSTLPEPAVAEEKAEIVEELSSMEKSLPKTHEKNIRLSLFGQGQMGSWSQDYSIASAVKARVQTVADFVGKYLSADRMILVVAGAVDVEKTCNQVAELFADLPKLEQKIHRKFKRGNDVAANFFGSVGGGLATDTWLVDRPVTVAQNLLAEASLRSVEKFLQTKLPELGLNGLSLNLTLYQDFARVDVTASFKDDSFIKKIEALSCLPSFARSAVADRSFVESFINSEIVRLSADSRDLPTVVSEMVWYELNFAEPLPPAQQAEVIKEFTCDDLLSAYDQLFVGPPSLTVTRHA